MINIYSLKALLILVLFTINTCFASDESFLLQGGYLNYPPLTYTDDSGKPAGIFIDIASKTLKHAGIPFQFIEYPGKRLYANLENGTTHLFLGIKTVPFMEKNTIASKAMIGTLEMRAYSIGNKPIITRKEDLVGKSVILSRGFSYSTWGTWLRNPENGVFITEAYNHKDAFEMLIKERADYVLNYKYIVEDMFQSFPVRDLKFSPLERWQCHFVVSNKIPDAPEIVKKIDASFEALVKAGKISVK